MYDDDPSWQLFFSSLYAMYKDHPNSIDIAGTKATIAKITKEELYDCYSTFYSPSNMALFVVGDVDVEKTAQLIKETVKDDNMFEGRINRIGINESDELRQKIITKNLEINTPMFSIAYKEKSKSILETKNLLKKTVQMDLISTLAFGTTSDLNNYLYENGYIYGQLNSGSTFNNDYGYMTIDSESDNVQKVLEIVNEYVEKIRKQGFTKADFDRIKKQKQGEYIKLYDYTSSFANLYLSMYFQGADAFFYNDELQKIDLDELNQLAYNFLDEKMQVLSIINPISN